MPTPATPLAAPHADLEETTIAALSERMARGELTARALVERYVARIEALDRTGPTLRSVLELNPDVLAIADALDDERRAKGPRAPLHGIPVLVKDNVDTGDRMQTSAGSLAFGGAPAAKDAHLVERLLPEHHCARSPSSRSCASHSPTAMRYVSTPDVGTFPQPSAAAPASPYAEVHA